MRKKESKNSYGVADDISFDNESENIDTQPDNLQTSSTEPATPTENNVNKRNTTPTKVDPNRYYSKYYTPKPRLGEKGGVMGRGAVSESERRIQFSVTCTPEEKELYKNAAKKDDRSFPDFIRKALKEYIENHNLK